MSLPPLPSASFLEMHLSSLPKGFLSAAARAETTTRLKSAQRNQDAADGCDVVPILQNSFIIKTSDVLSLLSSIAVTHLCLAVNKNHI